MQMNARLFEQENGSLVLTLAGVRELPGKGDMPAEPAGPPVQPHRHADRVILGEDVESRPVNLDVKVNLLLGPEVAELLAQVRRCRPLVEGADRTPSRGAT